MASPAEQPFSARFRQGRSASGITLNLTPMIDVVFLLLFFFLVASRFSSREGMLPAQLPARVAPAAAGVPRTPIRIRLVPDAAAPHTCSVTVDGHRPGPFPIRELAAELKRIQDPELGFDAGTPVHLLAGDDVDWDHVVNAYNAALAAGYERILFVASP